MTRTRNPIICCKVFLRHTAMLRCAAAGCHFLHYQGPVNATQLVFTCGEPKAPQHGYSYGWLLPTDECRVFAGSLGQAIAFTSLVDGLAQCLMSASGGLARTGSGLGSCKSRRRQARTAQPSSAPECRTFSTRLGVHKVLLCKK